MTRNIRILSALAAAVIATTTVPAISSAFTAGTVTAIAPDDGLNIRKWPGANSAIIDVYLLNEPISLTGRCKNIVTNVSFRIDGPGSVEGKYAKMKKANVWCQVMTDAADRGWARGTYIWPE